MNFLACYDSLNYYSTVLEVLQSNSYDFSSLEWQKKLKMIEILSFDCISLVLSFSFSYIMILISVFEIDLVKTEKSKLLPSSISYEKIERNIFLSFVKAVKFISGRFR